MARVVVIESGEVIGPAIGGYLRTLGHDVDRVTGPATDHDRHPLDDADLVLLDLDFADRRGLTTCRTIRRSWEVPIIAFTATNTELDRVLALQAGSDDCVGTDCSVHEVAARVEAVFRRVRPRSAQAGRFGALRLDIASHEAHVDDRLVPLTLKEFALLAVLSHDVDRVVPRRELMQRVWDDSWGGSSRTLDTHVNSLRSKLGDPRWIATVRGLGYRLRPLGAAELGDPGADRVASGS